MQQRMSLLRMAELKKVPLDGRLMAVGISATYEGTGMEPGRDTENPSYVRAA